EHNHSVTLQYKREFLTLSIETHRQYLKEFPGKKDASVNYSIGINYKNIAFSYRLEQDLANAEANYIESNRAYETGIAINPSDYNAISMRFGIGDNCRSIALCYRFIAPDSQTQLKWAREAEKAYLFVVSDTSQMAYYRASAMSTIGDVWREYRDFETAVQWYDRVITEYGNDDYGKIIAAIACFSKAECLYELGRYDEGLTAAENYFGYEIIFPDLKVLCDALANKAKGKCLYGLSRNSEAEASLNAALSYGYYDSEEEYRADALLYRGKAREAQGDHSGAHADLAEVVAKYKDRYWWYDLYTTDSKEELKTKVLRVKIDPMIDTIAHGESKTFTASIVYPDDTPASVPQAAATDWQWTCTGNEADGHSFEFTGNTATYKGGSGDFMDTIITAKCKINAGMYGAKGRNKVVEPYIWIEGDNQVPISLVNEDGRRIKFAPMYVPWDGTDCGPPPAAETPVPMTLQFNTHFTIENPDQIKLSFWGPEHTHETEIVYEETDINSKIFAAADRQSTVEVKYPLPSTEGDIIAKRFKQTVPGTEKMKFDLYYSGEVISLEVPIWKGPGYGTSETRVDMYAASNQVFNKSDCEDLNPEDYVTKNTKMFVRVVDFGARQDSVTVKVKTSVQEKKMTCTKIKTGVFQSECVVPVNKEYGSETIHLFGKDRVIIRTNPDSGMDSKELTISYLSSGKRSNEIHESTKKPALVLCAIQPVVKPTIDYDHPISTFLGIAYAPIGTISNYLTVQSIVDTVIKMNEYYNVEVNYSPNRKDDFDAYSNTRYNLGAFEVIYFTGHSENGKGENLLIFSNEAEWESGLPPNDLINSSTFERLYPDKSQKNKLVVLNACNSGSRIVIGSWTNNINSRCFIGWAGTPSMFGATKKFENVFAYVGLRWNRHERTTITNAWGFGLSPVPYGVYVNVRIVGDAGDNNSLP
ncbi:MAG: tetratricopeptide repeat protein, partial [Candidatus Wallbacteria bacterium]|nr:tetratricopeptide repeat protein [Candidatus Wallbacteria bacterium]